MGYDGRYGTRCRMDKLVTKDAYKKRIQRYIDLLMKQVSTGVPIEFGGFITHPETADMPTIEHTDTRKRPQFIADDNEGWTAL